MEQPEFINVAIVGGGPGCKAVMDVILSEKLSQLRMKLLGVACTNTKAVGYRYAKEMGLFTTQDYRDFYHFEDLHLIIELTGRDSVAEEILRTKPSRVRFMDHVVARLFWDIFQIEERRIQDRRNAEKALHAARDRLDERVQQRTAELSGANEQLKLEIMERRQAEKELQRKNLELERFTQIVSHDLKAPIVAVQGFASLFLKKYAKSLDEKAHKYIEQIEASGRRMEILVSDLLCLARTGQIVSTFEDVSSMNVVDDVVARLGPRLEQKKIAIHFSGDFPIIRCDKNRMAQVFENLLVNAIKFMGNTEAPRIDIEYRGLTDRHEFTVRDNGIGIDPAAHEKIFEMFTRLKDAEDNEGTGIGLAIVKRIVESHGGDVWVESEKGKGAAFHLSLPTHGDACELPSAAV